MGCKSEGVELVKTFIRETGIKANIIEYDSTVESVKSASEASGFPPERILKTLILKAGDEYIAAVLRGNDRLDKRKVEYTLGLKGVRFARPDEIKNLLCVGPGEVSPLTEGVASLRVIADSKVAEIREEVLVGGGSLKHLVRVNVDDLLSVLKPIITDISK